ncbi:MAG TPA: flagellar hook-basal body complex protein FliE [Desulfonatronum sp.]|nr:flagellar hook-basal body complex protein FliE [Desulfonatronum sp.]
MSITPLALKAYNHAAQPPKETDVPAGHKDVKPFSATLQDSLKNVNNLQKESIGMIESFASGERQNVHELMIALQKSSLAMSMTSAVRNKLMEAYKEVMRMPF